MRPPIKLEGFVKEGEHEELLAAGSVGHVCGHHFDASGRHVDADFCRRLIALLFDRLSGMNRVIAAAWGTRKTPAILAALRGGLVDDLVTDLETAVTLADG